MPTYTFTLTEDQFKMLEYALIVAEFSHRRDARDAERAGNTAAYAKSLDRACDVLGIRDVIAAAADAIEA